jgi:hypothetical protein
MILLVEIHNRAWYANNKLREHKDRESLHMEQN